MECQASPPLLDIVETAAVRLALFIRKYCTVHSRAACLFLTAYEAMNLASIALANEAYPWHQGVNSLAWRGMKFAGQTITFLHDDGTPDYILLITLVTTLCLFWLCVFYLMWTLYRLHDFEFKRIINAQGKFRLQQPIAFLVLVCSMLHEVMYIPYLDWLNQSAVRIPFGYLLQAALGATVIASYVYFSSYKLGSRTYSALSTPYYALYGKGAYSLFVVGSSLFSYEDHLVLHELNFIIWGGFWLGEVFIKMPFQRDLLSKIEISKGLLLLWTGFVLILADINQLSGSSLLFLHISSYFGLDFVLLTALQWYKERIRRKSEVSFEFEVELRLRWHLLEHLFDPASNKARKMNKAMRKVLDTQEIDLLCKDAFRRYKEKPYTLMCLIEYFFLLKEKIFVKVMLCKLQTLPKDALSFVDIACCEYAVQNALAATKSDQEAVQYYRFFQHIKRVKEEDECLCYLLVRLSQLFEAPLFRSSELTKLISALIFSLEKTKRTYESLSQIIGDNPVFGSLYAGFLRLFQHTEKAKAIESRIKHMKHEMISKYRAKEESVFFFDQLNLVVLVSLDADNAGKVLLSQGASLLGFQDSELMDSNCKVLIPEIFRHRHDARFRCVYTYRHRHILYSGVHTQIFTNKSGFCNIVHWKNRLLNYAKGKLAAFVAIRLIDEKEDFALVSGTHLTDMTAAFHNALSETGARPLIEKQLGQLKAWQHGEVIYRLEYPPRVAVFKMKSIKLISTIELWAVTLHTKESAIPSMSLSGKTVGFEVSSLTGTIIGEKEGKRILEPMSSEPSLLYSTDMSRYHVKQRKLVRMLTLLLLCVVVVGIAGQVGVVISMKQEVEDMNVDVVLIEEIMELNTHMQLLALTARELSFLSPPLASSPFTRSLPSVLASLSSIEQQLGNLTQSLVSYSDSGLSQFSLPTIVWWTVTDHKLALTYKNAINLASYLEASASRMLSSQSIDPDSLSELMRNAPGEARRNINQIVADRIQFHASHFDADRAVLVIPVFVAFYFCVVVLVLAGGVALVVLGKTRKTVVLRLAKLSTSTIINFHNLVGSRLEQVHGYEFPSLKVKGGRKVVYSMSAWQVGYWGVAMVAVGIAVTAFQVNYEVTYAGLQTTLYHQPFIFSLTSSIKTELASLLFWLRETYLEAQNYPPFLPANNLSPPASLHTLSSLSNLLTHYQQLRGGPGSYASDWHLQTDHFQFLYSIPADLTFPELHLGYTPSLLQLNYSVAACVADMALGEHFAPGCKSTEFALLSLLSFSDTNQAYFHDFANKATSTSETTSISILSFYCLAAAVYLVAVYALVATKLLNTLGNEVNLYGLMTNVTKQETVGTGKVSISTGGKVSVQ